MARVVVVGGGLVGMAVAYALQGPGVDVTVVDDADFPGLGETVRALGVARRRFGREPHDSYAARTWQWLLEQHAHPRSPLRVRTVPLDGEPEGAAWFDHLLALDGLLLLARRRGAGLRVRTTVAELLLAGGRVVGVRCATGERLPGEAVILAPGPRLDTLALDGLPDGFPRRFVPVRDTVFRIALPPEANGHGGREGAGPWAWHRPGVVTEGSWTFLTGVGPGRVLATYRSAGGWEPPDFAEESRLAAVLHRQFGIPGDAGIERVRVCADLATGEGVPFVGPVAPLGGAEGLFVAAGMGLDGVSLFLGVGERLAEDIRRYLGA